MSKKQWATIKIFIFFLLTIILFAIYYISAPTKATHSNSYTFNFGAMIYTFIIMGSILVIDFEKVTKKQWLIAFCLGLLSIGVTSPVTYMGIISGFCTLFAYLASVTLSSSHHNRLKLLASNKYEDITENLSFIFLAGCCLVFLQWLYGGHSLHFNFQLASIFRAIGAGVSEEIIFRLFLFAIILHIYKGEEPSKILSYLVVSLPFSLFHVIDQMIANDFIIIIPQIIIRCVIGIVLFYIAKKRDILTAIGIHAMYDIISFL